MKKYFLMAAFAMVTMVSNAQVYIGGEAGFWRGNTNTDDQKNYTAATISPEIGYVLSEKLAVGVKLGWNHKYIQKNDGSNSFDVAPYARYTFVKFGAASLFADGGFGFSTTKETAEGSSSANGFNIGIQPGIKVTLNNKIDFIAHAGFFGYAYGEKGNEYRDYSGFGGSVNGNNLSFGLVYNF